MNLDAQAVVVEEIGIGLVDGSAPWITTSPVARLAAIAAIMAIRWSLCESTSPPVKDRHPDDEVIAGNAHPAQRRELAGGGEPGGRIP